MKPTLDHSVVSTRTHGGLVLELAIERPEKRNALNIRVLESLTSEIAHAGQDGQIRLIAIRGANSVYSSGADLDEMRSAMSAMEAQGTAIRGLVRSMAQSDIPIASLIEGYALGVGALIAIRSHLVLIQADAYLQLPEREFGLYPSEILPGIGAVVGAHRALRWATSGERIPAVALAHLGVAEVFEKEIEMAGRLAAYANALNQFAMSGVRSAARLFASQMEAADGPVQELGRLHLAAQVVEIGLVD